MLSYPVHVTIIAAGIVAHIQSIVIQTPLDRRALLHSFTPAVPTLSGSRTKWRTGQKQAGPLRVDTLFCRVLPTVPVAGSHRSASLDDGFTSLIADAGAAAIQLWSFWEAWTSKVRVWGGGGRGHASPAVEKSAGDVPPEMMIFQCLFS